MTPEQRKGFDRALARSGREWIEMADHRRYFSDDNWQTIWQARRGTSHRLILDKEEADLIRYLAVSQSSWQGNAS